MIPDTPLARGRTAFCALSAALFLVAAEQTLARGDPPALFFFAPVVAVVATGHVSAQEAFVRSGFSVALVVLASALANVARGRSITFWDDIGQLIFALGGLFAFYLFIIVVSSAVVKRIWPASDHWTL